MAKKADLVEDKKTASGAENPAEGGGRGAPVKIAANDAVLTDAVRHVDIIHTSLAGMTAIVIMLLAAVALPVLGHNPVTQPAAFGVMAVASFVGIAGLYVLNFRVHKHVTNQAQLTEVLVNSLGQGFIVFGRDGLCGGVYSQACLDLLETVPAGRDVAEVLRVPEAERSDFKDWLDILYKNDHALNFEDVIRFFPTHFPHSQGRRIILEYKPVLGQQDEIVRIVVIATDQTQEYAARQTAERQQNFAEMICRIFKDRNQFQTTLAHLREFLEDAGRPEVRLADSSLLLRRLHTLKAAVKQFSLVDLGNIIHEVESYLRAPEAMAEEDVFLSRLRASCAKLGDALARVREEVSSLIGTEYEWRGNVREIGEDDLYAFARDLQESGADPALVRKYLSSVVAVPIRDCFRSFERELRELAGALDKQMKPVRFAGGNPRVLAQPMQEFLFSLTHICRNIADHGIELPVTRMARGKDAAGQVTITCGVDPSEDGTGMTLRIQIADDGNGIDPSRVRAKLAAVDPDGAWRFEDDQKVIQRIFGFGFTTREDVTTLSGRGVGTEAVEMEVKKLGGSIRVVSELYRGATFDIRLPYNLDLPESLRSGAAS